MTTLPPGIPEVPAPLHSIVAWPPEVLDTWMRRTQEKLGVASFGLPHLNLRAPFQTPLDAPALVAAFREALHGQTRFEVRIRGWKSLPHMIFLECEPDASLLDLHARTLAVGPSSRAPHDGPDFRPHLTLALGVLTVAEPVLWERVRDLKPPVDRFTVQALSLTREQRGEVVELHTFPLAGPGDPAERDPAERDWAGPDAEPS